jgi:DNA-binding CsgD family transcriptional regulator
MSPEQFVGRETELSGLYTLASEAASGNGRAAVITGEPGIGKSTLVDLVVARCRHLGMRVVRGAAEEMEQRIPLAALVDWLGRVPDLSRTTEFAVCESVVDMVEQWCAEQPLMLVLDDLQWADWASLSVLHRLGRVVGQLPLLLLVARRPVPVSDELEKVLHSLDRHGSVSITLEPLDAESVRLLLARLTTADPGPELRRLVSGAAGNPLYVNELVAALLRDGRIALGGGVAELARSTSAGASPQAPPSLGVTIIHRLDFLSQRAREVLQVAAVLGPPLVVTELSAILGTSGTDLLPVVRDATAAGLLTDSRDNLIFRHDLIREALADDVPATAREALHLDAAKALARAGAPVERVGEHLLGSRTVPSWAVEWLVDNAGPLTTRAPAVAVDLLSLALAQVPMDDATDRAVRSRRARAMLWAGQPAEAARTARYALARARGNGGGDAEVRWLLAQAFYQQGRMRDAQAVAEEALAEADLTVPENAKFQHFAGECRLLRGAYDIAAEDAAATALAARPDPDSTAYGLAYLSFVRYVQERMVESIELLDRAAAEFGHRETQADWDTPVEMYRAFILLQLDRYAEAEAAFDNGLRPATRHGSVYLTSYYLGKARLLFLDGRWDDALAEVRTGLDTLDMLRQNGGLHTGPGLLVLEALIALHRSDAAAREALARTPYRPVRGAFYDHLGRSAQALVWEAQGEPDRALASLLEFWEQTDGVRLHVGAQFVAPDIARLAVTLGQPAVARRIAAELAALADRQPTPTFRGLHALCEGLAGSDPDQLLRAADLLGNAGRVMLRGHAEENAAVMLAKAGRAADARAALATALATYGALDATWDAARARSRLRELGVRTRVAGPGRRATSGWDALTDTEQKVATLVAAGNSNPDVAAHLFISRRTVQTHVSSILAKLGCTSRVELAVVAARRHA